MTATIRTEARRRAAIALLKQNMPPGQVAKSLGVSYESVRKWARAYEADGRRGLATPADDGRGHPLAITEEAARAVMKRARREGLSQMSQIVELAHKMGHTATRWSLRRRLVDIGLWPPAPTPPKRSSR